MSEQDPRKMLQGKRAIIREIIEAAVGIGPQKITVDEAVTAVMGWVNLTALCSQPDTEEQARPSSSSSALILGAFALEWAHLEGFAAERLRGRAFAFVGESKEEAARYLRYFHGLTAPQWAEVEAFREQRADDLQIQRQRRFVTGTPGGSVAPSNVPRYDASSVAMQYRSLFGFAAQYTIDAAKEAERYLRDFHGLGAAEWDAVVDFLQDQEEGAAAWDEDDGDDEDEQ